MFVYDTRVRVRAHTILESYSIFGNCITNNHNDFKRNYDVNAILLYHTNKKDLKKNLFLSR